MNKFYKIIESCALNTAYRKIGKKEGKLHLLLREETPLEIHHIGNLRPVETISKIYKKYFVLNK